MKSLYRNSHHFLHGSKKAIRCITTLALASLHAWVISRPSVKKAIFPLLHRSPIIKNKITSLLNNGIATPSLSRQSKGEFSLFMQEYIKIDCFSYLPCYFHQGHLKTDYSTINQSILEKCQLHVDAILIKAIREERNITLRKKVSKLEMENLIQLVSHIYLSLLRRFPSDIEAKQWAKKIIETQNVSLIVNEFRQSRAFSTLGYKRIPH